MRRTHLKRALSSDQGKTRGRSKPASFQKIRSIAARLFATRGYYNTSMEDIASRVGILKGSLYHHVRSKAAILDSLIFSAVRDLLVQTQEVADSRSSPRERFEQMIRLMVRNMAEHQEGTAIYVTERSRLPGSIRRKYTEHVRKHRELLEAAAFELLAATETTTPQVDVRLAIMSILGLINVTALWYQPRGRLSLSEIEDHYVTFSLRILGVTHQVLPSTSGPIQDPRPHAKRRTNRTVAVPASEEIVGL